LFLFQEGKVNKARRRTKSSKHKKNKKHKKHDSKDKKKKKKKKKNDRPELEEKEDGHSKDRNVIVLTDSDEEFDEATSRTINFSNDKKRTLKIDDSVSKNLARKNDNGAADVDEGMHAGDSGGEKCIVSKSPNEDCTSAMEVVSDSDSLATGESEMESSLESGEVTESSASEDESDGDECEEVSTSVELSSGPVAYNPAQRAAASESGIGKLLLVWSKLALVCQFGF
jgi:hypothetical protein